MDLTLRALNTYSASYGIWNPASSPFQAQPMGRTMTSWHQGMQFRPLGRTGVLVSVLGLGTMNFGGRTSEEDCHQILDRAFNAGVNLIDTANVYGHDPSDFEHGRGRSESIIGAWLAHRPRDDVFVATKSYFPMTDGPGAMGPSRRNIIRECEASLGRLKTDHIDLYQLHHPSNEIPIDESLRALDDLVTSGKVRYVGTSTFAAWQLVESLWASSANNLVRFSTEQPVYNLLDRRVERELFPMAISHGIGLLTWSPLAGGLLIQPSGTDQLIRPGSRYDVFWSSRRSSITAKVAEVVEQLGAVAVNAGLSLQALALAWTRRHEAVSSVLIGPRTVEQLDDALASLDAEIEGELSESIDTLTPPGSASMKQYGHDGMAWVPWGPHRHPWR
jgi:aryl-alcohol dehydrogenase-like predicted oxidoreductase